MKTSLTCAIVLAALAGLPRAAAAQIPQAAPAHPTSRLLVLSKHDHTLAIIDPTDLEVLAKVPVGDDPHEVIASTDGTTAWVSNYGGGAFNTLAVVDLVAQSRCPPSTSVHCAARTA